MAVKVGPNVKDVKVGDHIGVGYFVDTCCNCEYCDDKDEVNCIKGNIFQEHSIYKLDHPITLKSPLILDPSILSYQAPFIHESMISGLGIVFGLSKILQMRLGTFLTTLLCGKFYSVKWILFVHVSSF